MSNISENACARVKTPNQYWMPLIVPEITVFEQSSPCHLQIQFKPLSYNEEAICELDPERLLSSLGQSSFIMD